MLIRMDHPERDVATDKLRALIEEGGYAPGDRLPPERQLIDLLDLGRSSLRRALEQLEREGAIWRHVGKGTFVAHKTPGAQDMLSDIAHQITPVRMMRARLCIEPAIAREAAVNASGEAVGRLESLIARARVAPTWAEYERHDDGFHRAVAEAADNLVLLALYDDINRVQREVAWGTVSRTSTRPPPDHSSFAEHDAIAAAIEAHDADGAFRAMRLHLQSVSQRLFGEF